MVGVGNAVGIVARDTETIRSAAREVEGEFSLSTRSTDMSVANNCCRNFGIWVDNNELGRRILVARNTCVAVTLVASLVGISSNIGEFLVTPKCYSFRQILCVCKQTACGIVGC